MARSAPSQSVKENAASRDKITEAGSGHGLQQSVLVGVMEVKGGPVQGGLIGDLLDGDIVELLTRQYSK